MCCMASAKLFYTLPKLLKLLIERILTNIRDAFSRVELFLTS